LLRTDIDSDDVTRFAVICLYIGYTLIVNARSTYTQTSTHSFNRIRLFDMYYEMMKKKRK